MENKEKFKFKNQDRVEFDNGAISGHGKIVGVCTSELPVIGSIYMIEVAQSSPSVPNNDYCYSVIPVAEVHISLGVTYKNQIVKEDK